MELVIIDYHQLGIDFLNYKNAEIIIASDLKEFYSKTREYIKQDYDLIISDEDPDGITSVIIYALSKNKTVNFKGDRTGLTKEQIQELKNQNIKKIIAFDWFALGKTALEEFEKIVYVSPRSSNLPNVNTSDIVYNAIPETGRFGRDISSIGTICDYTTEECQEKIKQTILEYQEIFPELINLAKENKLDRYNVYSIEGKETKFCELSLMFWAPFIIQGEQGNETLIKLVIGNRGFSIRDLFRGSSNLAVTYLRAVYLELKKIIEEETKNFEETKKEIGNLIFYQMKTHKPGLMSKFSSIITDKQQYGKVIAMKVKDEENKIIRYSLRTKKSMYKLGELAVKLGVGGGHENAAGLSIPIEREEWFENELIKAISPLSLQK